MNATNWQTLWPIQSGSSANWRMLTPRRVTQNDRQLKIYLKLGDFFQLSISKCTANVSIPRQDHFNLFHTLIWYSIHKILSQRPSVRAKYSSVWLYLVNSTLPKPVFPGDDGQQHLWCSGAPHQTWKGHHLFPILHLLLHLSTAVVDKVHRSSTWVKVQIRIIKYYSSKSKSSAFSILLEWKYKSTQVFMYLSKKVLIDRFILQFYIDYFI